MKTLILSSILAGLLFPVILSAEVSPLLPGPRIYRLGPTSDYLEGCFEPCACPIAMDEANGRFVLTHRGRTDGFDFFSVQQVMWEVPHMKRGQKITGSGTYRVHRGDQLQRLELDLRFDANPVKHFDSGLVPVTVPFPAIEATISVFGMFCYDTVFEVRAAPAHHGSAVDRMPLRSLKEHDGPVLPVTWGEVKARY